MLVCYSFSIAQPEHCEVVLQSEGKKPIRTSCAGTRNPFPSPDQARGVSSQGIAACCLPLVEEHTGTPSLSALQTSN